MSKFSKAQDEIVKHLSEGWELNGPDIFVVKSYEASLDKATKDVNFHRAILIKGGDPRLQQSYKFEMFRISKEGKTSRL